MYTFLQIAAKECTDQAIITVYISLQKQKGYFNPARVISVAVLQKKHMITTLDLQFLTARYASYTGHIAIIYNAFKRQLECPHKSF